VCMGMGIFAAVWAVTPLAELWSCLGGTLHQVQTRFGILLPEFVVLLPLAVGTIAFSVSAAQIAPWATEHGTLALLWQCSCGLLALLAMLEIIVATAFWGPTFIVHAFTSAVFIPLAFILTTTSSVTIARSSEMLPFVSNHWVGRLVYAVPPQYASLSPAKYASAAYFPANAAGISGVLLSIFLWLGAFMHARCAIVLLSVNIELKALTLHPRAVVVRNGSHLATSRSRTQPVKGAYMPLKTVDESSNEESSDGLLASPGEMRFCDFCIVSFFFTSLIASRAKALLLLLFVLAVYSLLMYSLWTARG
jgi:hypothetical protein